MNPEIKKEWVSRLRSGKYDQGSMYLRDEDDRFCCLGILCEMAVENNAVHEPYLKRLVTQRTAYVYGSLEEFGILPLEVSHWAGLDDEDPFVEVLYHGEIQTCKLSDLNDDGASFKDIADMIENQL
jgi:hypothetical protein